MPQSQTNPWHSKEEKQDTDRHITAITQSKATCSLPQQDDCKTWKDTKNYVTKQGPNAKNQQHNGGKNSKQQINN